MESGFGLTQKLCQEMTELLVPPIIYYPKNWFEYLSSQRECQQIFQSDL